MSMVMPTTNPWGPQDCQREDSVTCKQPGDKRINCRLRNILYESECLICKEEKKAGKDEKVFQMDGKWVYVGESSHPLYKMSNQEDSHQVKDWITSHEDLTSPPRFEFKIVRSFQDPLTRQ